MALTLRFQYPMTLGSLHVIGSLWVCLVNGIIFCVFMDIGFSLKFLHISAILSTIKCTYMYSIMLLVSF